MVCRPLLAVWHQVYVFLTSDPGADEDDVVPLPSGVLDELFTMLCLSPFLSARMDLPWSRTVFMMDSSIEGAGVIATEAELEEILAEARHAESKGGLPRWKRSLSRQKGLPPGGRRNLSTRFHRL